MHEGGGADVAVRAGFTATVDGGKIKVAPEKSFDDWTGGMAAPWSVSGPPRRAVGELCEVVLPELGITQGEFADRLGVSRRTVSEVLHEHRPVTPDMAIRLGKLLGNGAGLWLRMQQAVDVWTLEQQGDYAHIQQLKAA